MRNLPAVEGLKAALKSDTLAIVTFEIGGFGLRQHLENLSLEIAMHAKAGAKLSGHRLNTCAAVARGQLSCNGTPNSAGAVRCQHWRARTRLSGFQTGVEQVARCSNIDK